MAETDQGDVRLQMAAAEFTERLDDEQQLLLMDYLRDGAFHAMHAEWSVTKPTPSNVTTEHLVESLTTAIARLEAARAIVLRFATELGAESEATRAQSGLRSSLKPERD